MANELGEDILKCLSNRDSIGTLELSKLLNQDHQKVIGAVKSLQSLGDLIKGEQVSETSWELTEEGRSVAELGSHEAVVYRAVPPEGADQAELMRTVPNGKVGFSKAMSHGWIAVDKTGGKPVVRRKAAAIEDLVQTHLQALRDKTDVAIPETVKAEYKKRKLIQEVVLKSMVLTKGPEFSVTVEKQETDLTAELLASGAWQQKKFKEYNFEALGVAPSAGYLHPLMKMRAEIRKIFIEMGFQEMPTNRYVESSFWNFDALFQPQQHPARDAQDTFFVANPRISRKFPQEYLERVKQVHSVGGYGSEGYQCDWKIEEAEKNVLRTHTTAVSARMLYQLAQEKEFRPVKYFSVDRVFRNETLDTTHLAEFFQVEGVIADHNLTLGDLIGVLYTFYRKLGIEKLNFKPTFNPYTEPSMEVFSYHPGLGKWIELGNSGMFRPEMLLPMGLPPDVNVLGFGVSLERPTMIKYGLNNIRDLAGPKVDLQMVQNSPLCRLDK